MQGEGFSSIIEKGRFFLLTLKMNRAAERLRELSGPTYLTGRKSYSRIRVGPVAFSYPVAAAAQALALERALVLAQERGPAVDVPQVLAQERAPVLAQEREPALALEQAMAAVAPQVLELERELALAME